MNTWISVALLAFVSFFQKGDAITGWSTPTIGAVSGSGTLTLAEDQAISTTLTTYVATGGTGAVTYSIPTAVAPFAVSSGGVLTITALLDYETATSHTFEVEAVDSAGTPVTGTATITVTVTNVAPTFSNTPYAPCLVHGSGAGTTVTTVTATDAGSGTSVTYADSSANFLISAAGVITVNTGITLDKANSPYTFDSTATDGTATTTATVTLTVADSCSSAVAVAVSMMTLLAALFVNMS